MSDADDIKVELRQGNPTLAGLVREALEEEGFEVVDETSGELADLLVADVDSDADLNGVLEDYDDAGKSVVVSGLRRSRERIEGHAFLERPFSMATLVGACRKACGLGSDEEESDDENSDLFMEEEPEDLEDSGPTTREMKDEEANELEAQLGLRSGQLRDSSELAALKSDAGDEDVVEIDSSDSIVLNVDDLEEIEEAAGGEVRGEVAARPLDIDALQQQADELGPPPAITSNSVSQTMPDAPAIGQGSSDDTQADDVSGIDSSPKERRPTTGLSRRRHSSHGAREGLPDQLVETLSMASELVARHWNAVSLAARPADRAERIERVMLAALRDGPSAAEDELRRIPVQDGFSGSLGSWALRDVLMVLIFRRLRGRLEVSIDQNDYVLFIDRGRLDDIENLAGDNDQMLLDTLLESGAIDDETHRTLAAELDQELSAPLQMKLRSSDLVDAEALQDAKRDRARRLFADLVASGDSGWFAFMQVGDETGHSWPVNPLELELDELMSHNGVEDTDDEGDATVSASRSDLPELEEESDPLTREVPVDESEPLVDGEELVPNSESFADEAPSTGKSKAQSHDFQGETRESAPWEMELPPEAERSEAHDDESDAPDGASKKAEKSDKATVESGADDISLPDDAEDFFGDSRELDDLLKSVIDDSDAEVSE
jgi:hypothetical protein